MRQVEFTDRIWLPKERKYKEEIKKGWFHCWSLAYEEMDVGCGQYTVGVIEREDGTVACVETQYIQFIKEAVESRTAGGRVNYAQAIKS